MSNTPVFIVGATSFVGKHLVKYLKNSGNYNIIVVTRSLDKCTGIQEFDSGVKIIEGDLLDPESLIGFIEPSCVVINLVYNREASAEINLTLATNLINICKSAKINRLIHLSTADVVGRSNSDLIIEETPCHPITDYAATKLKMEETVLTVNSNEFEAVVLRSTAIIGEGGKNLIKLANDITSGNRFENYLKSCLFGKRRMNLVCIENVISSVMHLIHYSGNLNGEVFNISDDDSSFNNYIDVEAILMRKLDVLEYSLPRLTIPMIVLTFLLKCLGRDNSNPNRIYSTKKITDLGFRKTIYFEDAVIKFAEWYRSVSIENKL